MPINKITGFFDPPQVPCVKGNGLLCPARESEANPFQCIPNECHWQKKPIIENKQEKLV